MRNCTLPINSGRQFRIAHGSVHEAFAIGRGYPIIFDPTQLDAKKQVHRILASGREINDVLVIEGDDMGFHGGHSRQDCTHHPVWGH